jgi:hypothetical protein
MPAEGRPPGSVVALTLAFAGAAALIASGAIDTARLGLAHARSPEWLLWALAAVEALAAIGAGIVAWGILRAKPWAARRVREFAEGSLTGSLIFGPLVENERARQWFEE